MSNSSERGEMKEGELAKEDGSLLCLTDSRGIELEALFSYATADPSQIAAAMVA